MLRGGRKGNENGLVGSWKVRRLYLSWLGIKQGIRHTGKWYNGSLARLLTMESCVWGFPFDLKSLILFLVNFLLTSLFLFLHFWYALFLSFFLYLFFFLLLQFSAIYPSFFCLYIYDIPLLPSLFFFFFFS